MEVTTRETKICSCCKQDKDIAKFSKTSRNKDGYASACRDCHARYYQDWRKNNPGKIRAAGRRSRYGLTDAAFQSLVSGQNNCCALCKTPFVKVPCVDHDHSTGKIRGLLCSRCNVGLGLLGDSISSLNIALEYLKKSL